MISERQYLRCCTVGNGEQEVWEVTGGETGWHEGFVNIGYAFDHKIAFEVGFCVGHIRLFLKFNKYKWPIEFSINKI